MYKTVSSLILITLSFSAGYYLARHSPPPSPSPQPIPTAIRQSSGYHYTNPLLECESGSIIGDNSLLTPLKNTLTNRIDSLVDGSQVSSISLYFRDLNNGPWFGINENAPYTPASLLKTPVLIAYLSLYEADPTILDVPLKLSEEETLPTLTLLERMIIDSDNDSFDALVAALDYDYLANIHHDLDLPLPEESTPEDFISVKQYAGLFRLLYNASYLSHSKSELALSLLAQASYKQGLAAGIDQDIEIAHKYGVREGKGNALDQLHDCGIIYYPQHPYLLCLMTKGNDYHNLAPTLSQLSQLVYSFISTEYPLE